MNSKEEYNREVMGYENATKRPLRKYVYDFTLKSCIGPLVGKRVLDLACGEGVSSRMMLELGAKEVVGLDISDELIKKAQKHNSPGIHFQVADMLETDLAQLGKFHAVTAIMGIHYTDSKKKLKKLFNGINKTMTSRGCFYALTVNPDIIRSGYRGYGVEISRANGEGQIVKVELHDFEWNKFCEFTNCYWTESTYTKLLEKQGFAVKWLDSIIDPKAMAKYGHDFWKVYVGKPIYKMIKATKRKEKL